MGWFNFNSKDRVYNVTIRDLVKEFNIDISIVRALLKDAGYNLGQLASYNLKQEHLEVILLAYTQSVKTLYKESCKNFSIYSPEQQQELRAFFGKFVRKNFFIPEMVLQINDRMLPAANGKIFKSDLKLELIRDDFFNRIKNIEIEKEIASYQIEFHTLKDIYLFAEDLYEYIHSNKTKNGAPSFINHKLKWRVTVKPVFDNIKERIFSVIVTGHYHIFSTDEDANTAMLPTIKRGFSAVKQSLGEALKNNNFNSNPSWKIKYNLL